MPQPKSKAVRRKYFRLLSKGMTTTEACESVGVNRRTGCTWRQEARGEKRKRPRSQSKVKSPSIGQGGGRLNQDDRLTIADMLIHKASNVEIAESLGCSPATISREIARNCVGEKYYPHKAQKLCEARSLRPKATKISKSPELRDFIEAELNSWSSPEQISAMLKTQFHGRAEMQVVHETIYQALYVQGRGELRRDLAKCLRTGRAKRKPQRRPGERLPRFTEMTMISERPAEADDRAVPGHWEGDLIIGRGQQSAIGTLVERSTRYVLLVHLPKGRTADAMASALAETMKRLPEQLKRSLAWDQGSEMSQHRAFSIAADIPVYFCDPGSPWQRGSNENTNGLLRQYFPKGTDLSVHSRDDLDWVEMSLNSRVRKTLGWDTPAHRLASLLDEAI